MLETSGENLSIPLPSSRARARYGKRSFVEKHNSIRLRRGIVERYIIVVWQRGGWYFDGSKVILSLILTNFPWVGGVSFLIYYAGLQAIPQSVYEACELEGVTGFKRIVYIDLPLLVGQIKYFIIIGIINGVQVYDMQLILGFSAIDPSSTVPGYLLYYYTFGTPKYGYAASIGVVLFVITLTFTVISNKISDKKREENGI